MQPGGRRPPRAAAALLGPRFVGFRCFGVFALYCARNKQLPDGFHVFRTLATPRQVITKLVLRSDDPFLT